MYRPRGRPPSAVQAAALTLRGPAPRRIGNNMVTDTPPLDPVLKALGDPVRRRIVQHLAAGPSAVRPLADRFEITRPAISRHLRILTEAGVLVRRPVGRENHYHVEAEALRTVERWLRSLWAERLADLKALVEEETS